MNTVQESATKTQLVILSGVGVFAAAISYAAISLIGTTYPTPTELLNLGASPTTEERASAMAAQLAANCGNGIIWVGAVGAILGGLLALTTGLLRSIGTRTAIGVVVGVLLLSLIHI